MKRVKSFLCSLLFSAMLVECVPSAFADYDFETYSIVSDLVYTYKMRQASAYGEISELLSDLSEKDPELGSVWNRIMKYWEYVGNDMTVFYDVLPDGLPENNSLCIVVLGYALTSEGTMADELIGRCRTALACAEKYPEAYIAVTGGGTAGGRHEETEADLMAQWFIDNGISPDRLIIENRSLTTGENAQRTCTILLDHYPEIKQLAVVTSDYHIQLGCLVFQEQLLLESYKRESEPLEVISNAVYRAPDSTDEYNRVNIQASYVWKLADTRDGDFQ
ncbi:MAG: YdcF family protein [Eubacteriales bacterium]|nr:YdcF family protein [Eubacteriales bacterium]